MYPHEIERLLIARNYMLGGSELSYIISPIDNPQYTRVTYNSDNTYDIWDKYGNYYHITAIPFDTYIEKEKIKTYDRRT